MAQLRFTITMSLDGFVAGPSQSVDNPLGIGGMRLHEWAFELAAWRATHGLPGGEGEQPLADRGFLLVSAGQARGTEYPSDEIHGNPPKY